MDLRLKYLIDTLVGRPLVAALNLLAYPLGKVLRRDHALASTRVIVLCKLMGLGSIVQITPLVAALRRQFPRARIVFLTRRANLAYCDRIDAIDETLVIDDATVAALVRSASVALQRMWRLRSDLFVNLEVYSNIGALLAITSCARNRVGYYMTPRDQRAWGIYTHMVYFNRSAPICEVYLQAARCLGIEVLDSTLLAPRIEPADAASLRAQLDAQGIGTGALVLINPNSSELSHERRWPAAHFAGTARRLHAAHPRVQFVVVGGPGEEATGAELCTLLREAPELPVADLTGRLTLPELMALMRAARVFVTNDSGPMHLAFSLSVPTVALFGPVSPSHYGGVEEPGRVLLYHHLYCSPCVHHFLESPCAGDNQCMKLITPDEVVTAVEALLAGASPVGESRPLRYRSEDRIFGAHRRGGPRASS